MFSVFLFFLFGFSGCKKGSEYVFRSYYYGKVSDSQYVDIYFNNSKNTVFYIHGGGFIGGSARGKGFRIVRDFFLRNGFNVVSVEYRKCREAPFHNILEDIYKGVVFGIERLSGEYGHQEKVVWVGFSAGATAASIFFLGNLDFRVDDKIKYYILLSGVYSLKQQRILSKNRPCKKEILRALEFYRKPSSDIHIFLVEGREDPFDLYKGTKDSHMEYLKHLLVDKGVLDVKILWIDGGHKDTFRIFKEQKYFKLVKDFLRIKSLDLK